MIFRCKHPHKYLAVIKEQTVTKKDDDYELVQYHFRCIKCGGTLVTGHVRLIGGVVGFLMRTPLP